MGKKITDDRRNPDEILKRYGQISTDVHVMCWVCDACSLIALYQHLREKNEEELR